MTAFHVKKKMSAQSPAVVAQALNPSTQEVEAGMISVSSRPSWYTRSSSRAGSKAIVSKHLGKKVHIRTILDCISFSENNAE